jgi:hypothetical protein
VEEGDVQRRGGDNQVSLIDKTVPRLSTLIIDADKDWLKYNITNFGPGGVDLYSLLTAHAWRHLAGGADALSGIARSQLEYVGRWVIW